VADLILKDDDGDRYSFENIRTQGWLEGHTSGLDAAVTWLKERAVTLFRHGKDADAKNLRLLAEDMDRALRTAMEANSKRHEREHPGRVEDES
jgi:hypothetical protein